MNRTGTRFVPDSTWNPTYSGTGVPSGVASCAVGGSQVFIGQRASGVHPILTATSNGLVTGGFGDDLIKSIHGMHMQTSAAGDNFLWTTDSAGSSVSKWDPKTKTRVTSLGTRGQGLHPLQFGSVADLAFDNDGAIYISDGDGGINARVLKLDGSFSLVWANGNNGTVTDNIQWASPHSIAYDPNGHRVLVSDRNNNSLRFLDATSGAQIGEWGPSTFSFSDCSLPSIWSVRVDPSSALIFVGTSNFGSGAGCPLPDIKRAAIVVLQLPPSGPISPATAVTTIPIVHGFPHELCVDSDGSVYSAAVDTADLPTGTTVGAITRYRKLPLK